MRWRGSSVEKTMTEGADANWFGHDHPLLFGRTPKLPGTSGADSNSQFVFPHRQSNVVMGNYGGDGMDAYRLSRHHPPTNC